MSLQRIYGEISLRAGRREAGMQQLSKAAEKGDGEAALILSAELMNEDKEFEAAEVLRNAAAAGAGGVALVLADVLAELEGSEEEAERWYRVAVEENIQGALNNYGCFLSLDDGRIEEAEALLLRAVESGDELACGNLGRVYVDEGEDEKALPWLRRSLAAGNEGILPYLARAEIALGERAAAWEHVLAALKSGDPEAFLSCALYLEKYGDRHPDRSVEEMFMRSLDAGAEAHFHFAGWLKGQGRSEEAEAEYRAAIEQGEVNAHLNLANLLEDLGRTEEAEAELRAGIEAGDPWAASSLAHFLAHRGRPEEIPALIRRAGELGCPRQEVQELWIMYRTL
ncbi:tetratricopeptide repeat protein [Streptomyces sp. HMX112]|uniref:tetratricopeptide repeat protein n=1 Tax=Streptomyces sp. HMX112 TaxID=3390850 RepID=UPI003A80BD09